MCTVNVYYIIYAKIIYMYAYYVYYGIYIVYNTYYFSRRSLHIQSSRIRLGTTVATCNLNTLGNQGFPCNELGQNYVGRRDRWLVLFRAGIIIDREKEI